MIDIEGLWVVDMNDRGLLLMITFINDRGLRIEGSVVDHFWCFYGWWIYECAVIPRTYTNVFLAAWTFAYFPGSVSPCQVLYPSICNVSISL